MSATSTSASSGVLSGPVRVAIVGCGAVARLQRAVCYPRLPDLGRVVALCDPEPDRARTLAVLLGQPDLPHYANLDALLAEPGVDAVDICTPHAQHADLVVRSAQAGKHVLVEKPLATSLADGQRAVAAARAAGVVLALNEQVRFLAPLLRAREMIDRGAIGQLAAIRAHRVFQLPAPYAASGWRTGYPQAGAGVLIDQGPHYVHLLRVLAGSAAGDLELVGAVASSLEVGRPEDTVAIVVRFRSGLVGEALLSWVAPTPSTDAWGYAYGTEGSLAVHAHDFGLLWQRPAGLGPSPHGEPGVVLPPADMTDTLLACLADFLWAAARGSGATMSGDDGLRDLAAVDAAERSLRSGRLEPVVPT